jgi:hypothetical protein
MPEKREEEIKWEEVCENLSKLSSALKENVGSKLIEKIRAEIEIRSGLRKGEIEKALLTFQIKNGDIKAVQSMISATFLYQFLLNKKTQFALL